MSNSAEKLTLGVCGNAVTKRDGEWYTHHSFGRIVEHLAPCVKEVRYFAPQTPSDRADTCDYPLDGENVTVHPWAVQRNSLHALKRPDRIIRQYWNMVRSCDAFFLRGSQPLLWCMYLLAALFKKPVVHWIVGNPLAIMQSEDRGYGSFFRWMGILFARMERIMTRISMWLTPVHLITNGKELADIFRSPRTHTVVSTTITRDDFHLREDTCNGKSIRLLFVGMIRPEKGLEFLIRALPLIESPKPVHLALVGSWDQFSLERNRLMEIIQSLKIENQVHWEGYAAFGHALFDQYDRSDILVLPSISEGTPRVLVEARARSLPIVSTNVGGIPSSITQGEDGLLVEPRDVKAMAQAVSKIIRDESLRKKLITQGRKNVEQITVEKFVELVMALLTGREIAEDQSLRPSPSTPKPFSGSSST